MLQLHTSLEDKKDEISILKSFITFGPHGEVAADNDGVDPHDQGENELQHL
jgi:hypothetical protein